MFQRYKKRDALNAIRAENGARHGDNSQNSMNRNVIDMDGKWINCEDLHRIMTDDSCTILLLDCREREEYDKSRIEFKNIINIPHVKKGLVNEA